MLSVEAAQALNTSPHNDMRDRIVKQAMSLCSLIAPLQTASVPRSAAFRSAAPLRAPLRHEEMQHSAKTAVLRRFQALITCLVSDLHSIVPFHTPKAPLIITPLALSLTCASTLPRDANRSIDRAQNTKAL